MIGDYLNRYPKLWWWLISATFGLAPMLLLDAYAPGWSYAYLGALIVVGIAICELNSRRC